MNDGHFLYNELPEYQSINSSELNSRIHQMRDLLNSD